MPYVIMKKEDVLLKFFNIDGKNMDDYYYLIADLLYLLKIDKYVDDIVIVDDLISSYAFYDKNTKSLTFGNNIFSSQLFNNNSNKAIIYVLHELIHIIHEKLVNGDNKDTFIKVLSNSVNNKSVDYNSLFPLYEYQAYVNSTYILYNILLNEIRNSDFRRCKNYLTNIIYNNYYDLNNVFISPIQREIRDNNYDICYNSEDYYDNNTKILIGDSVNRQEFLEVIHRVNNNSFKGVDLCELSINQGGIKR